MATLLEHLHSSKCPKEVVDVVVELLAVVEQTDALCHNARTPTELWGFLKHSMASRARHSALAKAFGA